MNQQSLSMHGQKGHLYVIPFAEGINETGLMLKLLVSFTEPSNVMLQKDTRVKIFFKKIPVHIKKLHIFTYNSQNLHYSITNVQEMSTNVCVSVPRDPVLCRLR